MISKSTVDKIFSAVRVEEVIGEYIQLKRTGANYKGLSPFHDEKTPSFVVSPSKQIWKDFSSGKGGTAVSFLMEIENFSYPDALRYLAKKYGIEVEKDFRELSDEEKELKNQTELLYKIHEVAGNFFYEQLTKTDEGQNIGYSYFKERGLNDEIIRKFQLGYSPETKDAFTKLALEKGYEKELLEKSGLSIFKENSLDGVDRFRERVIFPIHNFSGRILGFGARTLKNDRTSKYINSPETEIYHKSNILYGISQSKQAVSKENNCLLVEGYMDVLSFHQVGIENVVASSGTALTKEQIRLIKRFTPNITILFDGDSAGIKASFRSIDILLEEDMNIRVLLFPDGHDPDSFTRKYPQEFVKNYIKENSVDFIQYKFNILEKNVENDTIKRAELVREIVGSIAFVVNPLKQEILIQQASRLLGISEKSLFSELHTFRSSVERQSNRKIQQSQPRLKKVESEQIETIIPLIFLEGKLIDLMIKFGNKEILVNKEGNTLKSSVIQEILNHFDEDAYQMQIPMNEKIVGEIVSKVENIGKNPSEFFYSLMDEEINQKLANALIEPYDISRWDKFNIYFPLPDEDVERLVYDTILRHKREYILKIINDEYEKMKQDTENYDKYVDKIKMLSELKIKLDEVLFRVI